MDVMVRVQQSTKKQEKYFGDSAWRPFATIRNVIDEGEVIEKLGLILKGERVSGSVKFMRLENLWSNKFQWGVMEGHRIFEWFEI